jgi:hypothetical protein
MNLKIKAMNKQQNIEQMYDYITNKINQNFVLSFNEQEFYFEATKNEFKQKIILLPQMRDYLFIIFYNIYLTDVNLQIYKMSIEHSNEIGIRELYGINLNHKEIINYLKDNIIKFKREILENDNLFKENNILKNLIKSEFKEVKKKIRNENDEIEKKTFNEILRAIRIYLEFKNLNIENQKIEIDNAEYDLKLDFFVHITFRHYYHILQETDYYFGKDHFKEIKPLEWREVIVSLTTEFNKKKFSLANTQVINFILNENFFRLVVNKYKKKIVSLFPLKRIEVACLDRIEVINI